MKSNLGKPQERTGIKRITVDEKLAEDLIRFEICKINQGVEPFFDTMGKCGEPEEVLVRKADYVARLGLPQRWDTLKEGQVFLVGELETLRKPGKPERFVFSAGKTECIRIDHLQEFKDNIKRMYSDLLRRHTR